ncbi:hypothetical protein NA57DRAFT_47277, partial [Rhizodiscina lignyota]
LSKMHSRIFPNTFVVLHFASGHQRLVEIVPNSTIYVGKFGSFPANLLLYRPYYLTFELLDKSDGQSQLRLRIVPPHEIHTDALSNNQLNPAESRDDTDTNTPRAGKEDDTGGVEYDIVGEDGTLLIRSNRLTVDDPSRQKLSHDEIEALKKAEKSGGKEIIAKILENHSALGEKTSFSLQKYTVRKAKKYLRRFTVLPADVETVLNVQSEGNAHKHLELREESLGLLMSWANVRASGGRWLVVDDTGGVVVAALAERMGILHPPEPEDDSPDGQEEDEDMTDAPAHDQEQAEENTHSANSATTVGKPPDTTYNATYMSANSNAITVLHPGAQPNTSFLKYFSFPSEDPQPFHPLYAHLKSLSWLAFLDPATDPALQEPQEVLQSDLLQWKGNKKSAYWRKRRRWERMKKVVEETREGGFDGLVVASGGMDVGGILRRLVPLVKGGGQVVAYSPTVEPLAEVMDLYSRERRAAFTQKMNEQMANEDGSPDLEDFPVNPSLLLAPNLQTVRARQWQVLPGRTHPVMMGRGGAEGYIFTATRVIPAQGKVEARGKFGKAAKRRKMEANAEAAAGAVAESEVKTMENGVEDQAIVDAETGGLGTNGKGAKRKAVEESG